MDRFMTLREGALAIGMKSPTQLARVIESDPTAPRIFQFSQRTWRIDRAEFARWLESKARPKAA